MIKYIIYKEEKKLKYWIIPCNVKTYDAIGAFNELKLIDWKQSKNLKSAKLMIS